MSHVDQENRQRVIVITGAGQGIGAAIAQRFAEQKARLVLVDVNLEQLQILADSLGGSGAEILMVKTDVADKEQVQALFAQVVEKFGAVDVLVNNAGIIRDNLISNISEQDWDKVLDVNLKGAFLCCQAAQRQDRQSGLARLARQHRPGQLHRQQGRTGQPDPFAGARIRPLPGQRQRRGAGRHRFADDAKHAARGA
jgi:NAD(P)-dependent dehydrogenase (short-subunit alcohol dehydrogenase family)